MLLGFLPTLFEGKDIAVVDTENAPSPPAKKRRVVRKEAASQHVTTSSSLTLEGSQGTKVRSYALHSVLLSFLLT